MQEVQVKPILSHLSEKNTTFVTNNYHDLPYYVSRIQRCKSHVKLRWLIQDFPDHKVVVEFVIQTESMYSTGLKRKIMESKDTAISD